MNEPKKGHVLGGRNEAALIYEGLNQWGRKQANLERQRMSHNNWVNYIKQLNREYRKAYEYEKKRAAAEANAKAKANEAKAKAIANARKAAEAAQRKIQEAKERNRAIRAARRPVFEEAAKTAAKRANARTRAAGKGYAFYNYELAKAKNIERETIKKEQAKQKLLLKAAIKKALKPVYLTRHHNAASKIQALVRGHQVRKRLANAATVNKAINSLVNNIVNENNKNKAVNNAINRLVNNVAGR